MSNMLKLFVTYCRLRLCGAFIFLLYPLFLLLTTLCPQVNMHLVHTRQYFRFYLDGVKTYGYLGQIKKFETTIIKDIFVFLCYLLLHASEKQRGMNTWCATMHKGTKLNFNDLLCRLNLIR